MSPKTTNYKILIIEDNPGDLLLIQDYLDEYFSSYNQTVAGTFSIAEEKLADKNNDFDIILLDLSLPDLDGMDLLNFILPLSKEIPVVILTGYTDIPFSILTLERGVSDYLLKDEMTPFSLYKAIIHNIERKKYVKEIERSQRKYSELFQLSPQPLIIYDIDTLLILDVNKAASNLYGYSFDEFIGKSFLDIKPKERHPHLLEEFKRINDLYASDTYVGLFKHKKRNGEIFTVEVYDNAASLDKQNIRTALISDVSEKEKYIEEIEDQNARLKDIAWIQSHIVRAPLARIMGLIDIMSNSNLEVDQEEQEFMFKGVIDSAHELDRIIKEITIKASAFKIDKENGG